MANGLQLAAGASIDATLAHARMRLAQRLPELEHGAFEEKKSFSNIPFNREQACAHRPRGLVPVAGVPGFFVDFPRTPTGHNPALFVPTGASG
ncbi:hypothetical protein [Roseovarius indicus]|uniref:hypothetical protein n=1 Tax=Roseovarius indicus TaxID=540747 RepID=UPI0032EBB419